MRQREKKRVFTSSSQSLLSALTLSNTFVSPLEYLMLCLSHLLLLLLLLLFLLYLVVTVRLIAADEKNRECNTSSKSSRLLFPLLLHQAAYSGGCASSSSFFMPSSVFLCQIPLLYHEQLPFLSSWLAHHVTCHVTTIDRACWCQQLPSFLPQPLPPGSYRNPYR